jgi:hypothetical protein
VLGGSGCGGQVGLESRVAVAASRGTDPERQRWPRGAQIRSGSGLVGLGSRGGLAPCRSGGGVRTGLGYGAAAAAARGLDLEQRPPPRGR